MAATGPTLAVETPTRAPLRGGLLAVANVIEATDAHAGNGINYIANPAGAPLIAPGLCWPLVDGVNPKVRTGIDSVSTDPFALYFGVECGLLYSDDYGDRAKSQLEFNEGYGIEGVLESEYFTAARLAASPTAVSPVEALGRLETLALDGLLTLHSDRNLATHLIDKGVLKPDAEFTLFSLQGSPLANGSGYVVAGPQAGQHWLYATGQVNIWRGATVASASVHPAYNTAMAIAERIYSITIDGPIVAILVDTTL